MAKIESAFFDLSYLEDLAAQSSVVHRLDPRIKVVITAVFVLCVVSFDKYAISALLPFVVFLLVIAGIANIPLDFIIRKLVVVSPFAIMVGIFNPFLDQQTIMHLGSIGISGGIISFVSILLRFSLTVGAMLVLIATAGFNSVCMAMVKLGMPKIFAVQLLMLYRYIFVFVDEGLRMFQARTLRSFQKRAMSIKTFSYIIGQMLLRTIDRAQRIHLAMLCRGFDGTIRIRQSLKITTSDITVLILCLALLLFMRSYNIPVLLGSIFSDISA
jgi:cobalt/nickel transport system permease protein